MYSDVAVIIPSRIGSTRLARKPLELIGAKTLIERVIEKVRKTEIENIYVATDSKEIADLVSALGVKYIMTDPACESGTDRVHQAFMSLPNVNELQYVVNVQGDMPFVEPSIILSVIENLKKSSYGIMTPVIKVERSIAEGDSNVKVVVSSDNKALYFSRSMIPYGANEFLYHVGIYGFRKDILEKFVRLPQPALEKLEKLEQLRALYYGIDIGACCVENDPMSVMSVDTIEDLHKAKKYSASLGL